MLSPMQSKKASNIHKVSDSQSAFASSTGLSITLILLLNNMNKQIPYRTNECDQLRNIGVLRYSLKCLKSQFPYAICFLITLKLQ